LRVEKRRIPIEGQITIVEALMFDNDDRLRLGAMYNNWVSLKNELSAFRARSINFPEGISESAFCLCFDIDNCGRVLSVNRGSVSFDVINFQTNMRLQIKATSIESDLTSFGPTSVWDELFFLDFYRDGNFDGTFDIYYIPDEYLFDRIVNRKKNETFRDQQAQGRRPRLSVEAIIEEYDIQIMNTCNIHNIN